MRLLVPIVGVVFVAFLVTGLALPVLPLHIRGDLGLGTLIVGLVAGAQFGAGLLVAGHSGGGAVFLVSALAVLGAMVVAVRLQRQGGLNASRRREALAGAE